MHHSDGPTGRLQTPLSLSIRRIYTNSRGTQQFHEPKDSWGPRATTSSEWKRKLLFPKALQQEGY